MDDGANGRIKIDNQWAGDESTTGYEVKYLQMDDKIIDLTGGLLYRESRHANDNAPLRHKYTFS